MVEGIAGHGVHQADAGAAGTSRSRSTMRRRLSWPRPTNAMPRPYRSRSADATVLFPDAELPRRTISVVDSVPVPAMALRYWRATDQGRQVNGSGYRDVIGLSRGARYAPCHDATDPTSRGRVMPPLAAPLIKAHRFFDCQSASRTSACRSVVCCYRACCRFWVAQRRTHEARIAPDGDRSRRRCPPAPGSSPVCRECLNAGLQHSGQQD